MDTTTKEKLMSEAQSTNDDGRSTPERSDERAKWTKDIAEMFRGFTKDPDYQAYLTAADFLDPQPSDAMVVIHGADAETPGTEPTDAPEVDPKRAAYTQGLREVADWLDAHPEVELPYLTSVQTGKFENTLDIFINSGDQRATLSTIARAMGEFEKVADGRRFRVVRRFAGIAVTAQADRDEVCERVVTGTHQVTRDVPDPEILATVPLVSVTETVEDVEWICSPLLADPPKPTLAEVATAALVAS